MRPTAGKAALRPAQNSRRSSSDRLDPAARRAVPHRDRLDLGDEMVDLRLAAVELDDQQRRRVERIAGVDEGLGGLDGWPVHDLHAAGNDARADDAGDAVAGALDRGEADEQRARAVGGFGRMRTVTSVTTPSMPSEPTVTPSRS